MLGPLLVRLREWIAVDDPDERIEGSGDPITSPQHRRSADAERFLQDGSESRADRDGSRGQGDGYEHGHDHNRNHHHDR